MKNIDDFVFQRPRNNNVADFLITAIAGLGFVQLINYCTSLSISFHVFAFA
jgi:hypothetical protein